MGLKFLFDDEEANKRIDKHVARINKLIALNKKLADDTEKDMGKAEKETKKKTRGMISQLKKWRWEIVTVIFFLSRLVRAVQKAYANMADAAEGAVAREGTRSLAKRYEVDLGTLAATLRSVANETISVRESIALAQAGLLQDQGQFVEAYDELWQAARVAAATAGGEATDHFETFLEAIVKGDGAILDSASSLYQGRLLLQNYAESIGTTVDELDQMTRSEVLLNGILGETQALIENGAGLALEQAEDFEVLAASWDNFKGVMGEVGGELLSITPFFQLLNNLLVTTTQLAIMGGASLGILATGIEQITAGTALGGPLMKWLGIESIGSAREVSDRILREGAAAMGYFSDEVDAAGLIYERFIETPTRNIDPIIDHILKREDIMEKHNHRVEQIERQHTQKVEDIHIQFELELARIERRAQRDRAKALRSYNSKIASATDKYLLKQEQEQRDHQLRLLHNEREFYLTSIQNERLYRYERGLLVGYGDVLAIEDLDARYALEQEARGENQAETQQQERDKYAEAERQRAENFDLALAELQKAYDEQLLEIRIRMEEQIQEEHIQRQEAIRKAIRDYQQRLEEEQYMHDQALEQWNQHWAKIARQVDASSAEITQIINTYFGPTGEATQIINDFIARFEKMAEIRGMVEGILGPRSGSGRAGGISERRYYGGWDDPRRGRGYQYGGSGTVFEPTTIRLGEGHTPERFNVTPLAAATSSLVLSWGGGTIPVEGRGDMGGANMASIGDAIAKGLVVTMQNQLQARGRG